MSDGAWSDLSTRLISAAIMALVGLVVVWAGGLVFQTAIAAVCGIMIWELVRMIETDWRVMAVQLAALGGAAVFVTGFVPAFYVFPILAAAALVGFSQLGRFNLLYLVYALAVLLAGYEMIVIREAGGAVWLVWLICVVIASDVAGYFAGRLIGGPKFWPAVSPKKTWSGTVAGWGAAFVVGVAFWLIADVPSAVIVLSVLAAFAAQLGDLAESAIKRKVGVKDSSELIPGHGGVLDRFDAMLGASVFLLLVSWLTPFPMVTS